MLGDVIEESARDRTKQSLNFKWGCWSSLRIVKIVCSPNGPRDIIVSDTVYRLTEPSFRIFVRIGKALYAIEGPIAHTAIQAVVLTFQKGFVSSLIKAFFAFGKASGPSLPIAQSAKDFTFESSSYL